MPVHLQARMLSQAASSLSLGGDLARHVEGVSSTTVKRAPARRALAAAAQNAKPYKPASKHMQLGLGAAHQPAQQARSTVLRASAQDMGGRIAKDVGTDTRYFDGDLAEEDDDDELLGFNALDEAVLGTPQVDVEEEEDKEEEEMPQWRERARGKIKKSKYPPSPYMDVKKWHVLDFWDAVVAIAKDGYAYDFTEVYAAAKIKEADLDKEDAVAAPDMVFEQIPTKHLHNVPVQCYETVDWTRIETFKKDNGDPDTRGEDIAPRFTTTEHRTVKMYFIRDPEPDADISELDFSEVFVLNSENMTLTKSEVKGLENIDLPTATLVLRADGLKVVNLSTYDTVDDVVDREDRKRYEARIAGTKPPGTFDLPKNFGEDLEERRGILDDGKGPRIRQIGAGEASTGGYKAEQGDGDPNATDIPAVDLL